MKLTVRMFYVRAGAMKATYPRGNTLFFVRLLLLLSSSLKHLADIQAGASTPEAGVLLLLNPVNSAGW